MVSTRYKCVFASFIYFAIGIGVVISKEIATVAMGEEIGKGVGKIAFHLNSLINECEPESLTEWYEFMQEFLDCKEKAVRQKTYEELMEVPNLAQIEEFCTEWPSQYKCYNDLAAVLNTCYEKMNGMKMKGSEALKFANSFSHFVCHHKLPYLNNIVNNTDTYYPADRRPLKCYTERKMMITECTAKKFKAETSPNLCKNLDIVRECFHISYQDCDALETKNFLMEMFTQIAMDLHCETTGRGRNRRLPQN